MPRSNSLSLAEARRIALAAQGFARPRREQASKRDVRRVFQDLAVVQIDSVNVVARAHTLPAFSRAGSYRADDLFALAYGGRKRALFEYWGHAASLLPLEYHPLLRWRMARAARGDGMYLGLARFGRERRDLIQEVRREIVDRGALSAGELLDAHKGEGGWWGWSDSKSAVEWLFWSGELTTATRRGTFERVYDLPERVFPASVLAMATPSEADAQRELLRISAKRLGVATERCLRDYFRLRPGDAKPRIAELVEAGDLIPVIVDGWDAVAYLARDARCPRRVGARALLAPFDPLIWQRERVEALFGTRIRLELYTPREKRVHGYYVLPFLLGETLAARVDLKAERNEGTLRVQAAHTEAGANPVEVVEPLAAELRLMAQWLGLEVVRVERKGDLGPLLAKAMQARPAAA